MTQALPDLSGEEKLRQAALRARNASDAKLPELTYWTDDERYQLHKHQRVAVAWLYLARRGIVADTVGLGKTGTAIGLIALMKQRGELTNRALIIMRPAALLQWRDEFSKFAPRLRVETATGTRSQRVMKYASGHWDVMLINYAMLLHDRRILDQLDWSVVISDDVDPLRNKENATATVIKRLADNAPRSVVMSGTPLQTRLHELHSLLETVGGTREFGTEAQFERRYVRKERRTIMNQRTGRRINTEKIVGYKNMEEFKRLVTPYYLRRTHRDLDASDLPEVVPNDVWLDLYPRQREAYSELQRGVIRMLEEEGETLRHASAMSKLIYGSQITAGLDTLGHEYEEGATSVKADWIINELTGDLADTKVVLFAQFKNTIRALHRRMDAEGIRYVTFWGDEPDPHLRRDRQRQFWEDPRTQVCIGTSAMEQSLNLQVANVLINVDMLMNPSRMEQLSGRVRRLGSEHPTVYVFNLLTRDTHEERVLPILQQRQALSDYVFGERSDLFEALTPAQLLYLIRPD